MPDERFLIVRLGSLGDIVHTLPAASALRDSFPSAPVDWLVDQRWRAILDGNRELSRVIPVNRASPLGVIRSVGALRSARYSCAIDFQGLYKSSILARISGAPRRYGFAWADAREGPASLLYTDRIRPIGAHIVDQNLSLAAAAGAHAGPARFSIPASPDAEAHVERELKGRGVTRFFVLSPGGGWRSKCWPAERFGDLHHALAAKLGFPGIVSFGPGEERLASEVSSAAGKPQPILLPMNVGELIAALRRARFLVAADTGPLHLGAAIGTPVVGLYGPTDPARNGPYAKRSVVVRNARPGETTYQRGAAHSGAMLRITVEDVLQAVDQLMGKG